MTVSQTQLLEVYQELEKRIVEVDLRQGGPRGPKGRKGSTGDKGPSGPTGPQGPSGNAGKQGPKGEQGTKGPKGDRGATGPAGRNGVSGIPGRDGSDGNHGRDGTDGVSVVDASIDFDGHLTLQLSDGTFIDAGLIHQNGAGDITYVAGGGIPDSWKKALEGVIEDLEDHLNDFNNPHRTTHDNLFDNPGAPDNLGWLNNPHETSLANLTDTDLINVELGDGLFYRDGQWINRAAFNESWPTGLGDGGELNIGPGVNDIEVIAGLGAVTDNYTNPISPPVVQGLQWPQINTAITAASPVAGSVVWFTIADTGIPSTPIGNVPINVGELKQYAQPPSPSLARIEIPLGLAIHNGNEWKEVSNPKVLNQAAETLREIATVVLPFSSIVSGGSTRETGTFQLEQDEGTVWENNRNWHVDKSDPNRETLPAASPINFQYVTQDFSSVGVLTSTFDPDTYDVGGTPTPVPGGGNVCTIQKLYIDPANNYWVLYGQETYQSFFAAEANISADLARSVIPFILQNSILLGYAVIEKGKNNWDPDEAVWLPAGGATGGSGGGGTPITDHNNLNGIGPDDHHNQVHLLYGPDHSDVNSVTPIALRDLLAWDGSEFSPDRRTRAVGDYVEGQTYNRGDEVYNGSDLSEALVDDVGSYPYVAPTGDSFDVYQGDPIPTSAKNAKQVIFGQRYTNPTAGFFINGYRIYTVAGNDYEVVSVSDPLGTPVFTQIATFTATSGGWRVLPINSIAVATGTVFDLICTVSEPDPTPIEVTASYDYQTPQNNVGPASGQIIQGRSLPSVLSISYTDAAAGDRTAIIQGLSIGDKISIGSVLYSVQTNQDQGLYADVVVAPALTTTPTGIQDVTFETVASTPITIGEDLAYWPTSTFPEVQGLLGIDAPYADIVPDTNAYGLDISIQEAFIPDQTEWRLKIVGPLSGGGGGGGGSFTPDIFAGAGTTGYVPDPVTESGKYLLDDGTWTDTIDGGTY